MKRSKLLTIPRAATRMLLAALLLTMTAQTAWAADVTLPGSDNYTANDGDVLTGSTSGTVTIAADAKITLSGVTITGGIVCDGSATITLAGTNSVTGAYLKAGIQIGGSGTTLTIKGDGSLTANGGSQSAGIGLSRAWDVDATGGNIVIESGNITATGDDYGAGIGTGVSWGNTSDKTATIGNITIKGGTVRAIGGTNQFTPGSGIGKGGAYAYGHAVAGTITIYDGIDMVDASSISESVTYMHDETDVTANASNYFTITEDGNHRIIVPKDDTDYTITIANDIEHGTLTGAATAKYMEKVTITATPDLGYRLIKLVVKDAQNNDVATTGNTFLMPKGNVTVSAVFEQGSHGTTEFVLGYFAPDGYKKEATIYDGVTTVNLQSGIPYGIGKDYHEEVHGEEHSGIVESSFLLDNNINSVDIPYAGGTGEFVAVSDTKFNLNSESGFYDITMTDVGNGKWSVSILKTVGKMDDIPDQTYTGSEITPEPLVLAGSLNLTKGTDYEYSYTNNTNVGTAKVTVTFKGDYASISSIEKEFTITKATPTVTAPTAIADLVYNGSAQALVTGGTTDVGDILSYCLEENGIYSADIPTGTNAGTYTVYYKVDGSDNWNAVAGGTVEVPISPKAVTVTAEAKSKEYGAADPELTATVEGLVGEDAISYTVSRTAGEAVGEYTITPTGEAAQGNYTVSFVAGTLAITAKTVTDNNALKVTQDQNGYHATFTGSANDAVNIPDAITVKSVTLERNFSNGKYATLMLPFTMTDGMTLTGAKIYQFVGVEKVEGQWIATMQTPTSPLQANTPYLVEPVTSDLTDGKVTFDLNGGMVTLKTETSNEGSTNTDWQFVGTYTRLTYGTTPFTGNAYGFASKDKTVDGIEVKAGEFVYAKEGAAVPPLHCFLTYKNGEQFAGARAMTRGAGSEEDLPQSIIVRLVGTNGETTNVMTLDTRTGEISTDGWYDMSGRKLDGKPRKKGLYINNGKKIVINDSRSAFTKCND